MDAHNNIDILLRFRPISNSWVAVHPRPRGVVQFVGGAFFGTFGPTLWYRYLFKALFDRGYTIVVLPFRFTFRHWPVALKLLRELYRVRESVIRELAGEYAEFYNDDANYSPIGHSLGCKYIMLLEVLSDRWQTVKNRLRQECRVNAADYDTIIRELVAIYREVKRSKSLKTPTGNFGNLVLGDRQTLWIAPDFSDTERAIPFFGRFLDRFGLGVRPTRRQTQCLLTNRQRFDRTATISFAADTVAGSLGFKGSNIFWLYEQLQNRIEFFEFPGDHLEPLGIVRIGDRVFNFIPPPWGSFAGAIATRKLEPGIIEFLIH